MTSFGGQLLLESLLIPAVVSGLIVFPTRWLDHRVFLALIYAAALFLAIAVSYVLVFGWPISSSLGARQKIVLLMSASLLLGIGLSLGKPGALLLLVALSIIGPLWIAWPLLRQGEPAMIQLVIPVIVSLWVLNHFRFQGTRFQPPPPPNHSQWLRHAQWPRHTPEQTVELGLLLVIMAIGLAGIALFARTLSMTQLSLALASALFLAVSAGRQPPAPVLSIAGTTMFSGLLIALLLYSEASLWAALTLCCAPASPLLASVISDRTAWRNRRWPSLLIASILTTFAVGIAWIDAGMISVYEGAQHDGDIILTGDGGHDWKSF